MGVLWNRVRERFPKVQVHPSRDQATEQFDPPNHRLELNVKFGFGHPPPLVWFVHDDDSELIQVQQDRFVFNWRRREGEYPRYEHVRKGFVEYFEMVQRFLSEEGLTDQVSMNHWEVTYLNHIHPGTHWREHRELGVVIPSWNHRLSDNFLPDPEDVAFRARYRIFGEQDNPLGRLHIVVEPEFDTRSHEPLINLRLTARGRLEDGTTTAGLHRSLDIGHEWIVCGFSSITSRTMHEDWERER